MSLALKNRAVRERLEGLAMAEFWSSDDWQIWDTEWKCFDNLSLSVKADGPLEHPDSLSIMGTQASASNTIDWSSHAPVFMVVQELSQRLGISPLPF
jgi:hypothetical protein